MGNYYTQFTLLSSTLNLDVPNELLNLQSSDIIGKASKTLDDAHDLYIKYSILIGFGVRKDNLRHDKYRLFILLRLVCLKEGTSLKIG